MIAICPNPFRDVKLEITLEVQNMLRNEGYDTCICPVFAADDPSAIPQSVETTVIDKVKGKCSMLIVIGGDGTMLSVARSTHTWNVPLLGVNLGTKGFMAALERDELPLILDAVHGNCRISKRMMLDVELWRNGELIYTDCALNDAVMHGYGDCIYLTARCDGDTVTSFSGDGIILSTPTGSTGYSMSAGGPIVEPDAKNIILSPICAHMMSARTFVLGPERTVTVTTAHLRGRKAYLSVDGAEGIDLMGDDMIKVIQSKSCTLMANPGRRSFYEIAYEKLK